MKIKILSTKEEFKLWDKFVMNNFLGSIFQTSSWGKFQNKIPRRTFLCITCVQNEQGEIIGGGLIVKHLLPLKKSFFYCPGGPIWKKEENNINTQELWVEKVKELGVKEGAVFLRMGKRIKTIKTQKAKNSFMPKWSLKLNLLNSEEDILKQMKPKGRYNIKVAQKRGVTVIEDKKRVKAFYQLITETTNRDGFKGHGEKVYQNMVDILEKGNLAKLYLAKYKGEVISGVIITFFKDTAIYYYGASSNKYREVMAPYLLQWHAIKEAKNRELKVYDFLGIAPPDEKNHPWLGVTSFKKKFGGEVLKYEEEQEIIFSSFWNSLINIAKWLKKTVKPS